MTELKRGEQPDADADDAWWPPTFTRLEVGPHVVRVVDDPTASHNTRRWISSSASRSRPMSFAGCE